MVARALKILGLAVLAPVLLVGIAVGGALGYRAHLQHEIVLATQVASAHGISEASYVEIGGVPQWIQIRGDDSANPVLLFVHGGPAVTMIPFTVRSMRSWEKDFTIVHWDQRGAGRTYLSNGGADSTASGMRQIIDDGLRVSDYVRNHLGKDKLIVMGEYFGSAVALEMVRARPANFYAYVGTGQSIDMPRASKLTYQLLLERLRAIHDDDSVQQLTAIGPPPYDNSNASAIEEQILGQYLTASEHGDAWCRNFLVAPEHTLREAFGVVARTTWHHLVLSQEDAWCRDFLLAPGYSLDETLGVLAGATQHRSVLMKDAAQYTALAHGSEFSVPLFFFQGTEDILAPQELVSEFIEQIKAPRKELVLFQGAGHNAFYFQSGRFLDELKKRVRPLAVEPSEAAP